MGRECDISGGLYYFALYLPLSAESFRFERKLSVRGLNSGWAECDFIQSNRIESRTREKA